MKQNYVWLRMIAVSGTYPIPTSEADYLANLDKVDAALPTNGGKLQADGSWLQDNSKVSSLFAKNLRATAHNANQLYMPIVNCDRAQVLTVLDSPTLQSTAADNLIALMGSRFDAPWDGTLIDFEGISPSATYRAKLSDFLYLLSYKIRKAGYLCGISATAIYDDRGLDYDDAYVHDYAVIAKAADWVDMRCYVYWNPTNGNLINRSLAPYWWTETSINYALSKGIPPQRLHIGVGNYSMYVPVSNVWSKNEITYVEALQIAKQNNASVEWIERNDIGIIRERFADTGPGHIWIADGDTIRHKLLLVDKYNLNGITLFAPGMGDAYHWQIIKDWKA